LNTLSVFFNYTKAVKLSTKSTET